MTKPGLGAIEEIAVELISRFFNGEQEPQNLPLDGQGLDQAEGEPPASGKLDIVRGPRP